MLRVYTGICPQTWLQEPTSTPACMCVCVCGVFWDLTSGLPAGMAACTISPACFASLHMGFPQYPRYSGTGSEILFPWVLSTVSQGQSWRGGFGDCLTPGHTQFPRRDKLCRCRGEWILGFARRELSLRLQANPLEGQGLELRGSVHQEPRQVCDFPRLWC